MTKQRGLSASVWAVVGLTAIGAALRFFHLTTQSLWIDEAFTITYARIFGDFLYDNIFDDHHGPLHSWLLFLWTRLFGTGEFSLRSIEAVLGTVTIPAFYWALRPLGRPKVALVATALLAVNPFHVWYSQEVRNYAQFMLVGVVSTGLFVRILLGAKNWWSYGVLNFVGLLSNFAHVFTIAAHGWVQLLRGRGESRVWRGLIISWVVTVALMIPWGVSVYENQLRPVQEGASKPTSIAMRGETSAPAMGIPYAFFVYSVGYSLGPSLRELRALNRGMDVGLLKPHLPVLALSALAFGIAALLGVWRLFRSGPGGRVWIWMIVVPLALTFATSVRGLKVFNPRYAAAAMPAYLLALAEGVCSLRSRRWQVALGVALMIPTTASLGAQAFDSRYYKDDARSGAEFTKERVRPGDGVFVIGSRLPLERYYWREIPHDVPGVEVGDAWLFLDRPIPERLESFDRFLAEQNETYVFFLRDDTIDPTGSYREHLRKAHELDPAAVFPGCEIWIVPKGSGS